MKPQPLDLPAPGQPLDRGMSSLGLVMLVGAVSFGAVIATSLAIWGFGTGGQPLFMPFAVVLGVARVVVHAIAGWRLSRGRPTALRWIAGYAAVGVAHAIALGAWLSGHDAEVARVAGVAAVTWPLVVLVASHRRGAYLATGELRGESAAASVIALLAGLVLLAPLASVLAAWFAGPRDGGGVGTMLLFLSLPSAVGVLAVRAGRLPDPRGTLRALAATGQVIAVLTGLVSSVIVVAGGHFALALAPFLVGTCVLAPIALRDHAAREPQPSDPSIGHGSARLTVAWILLAQGLVTVTHLLMSGAPDHALGSIVMFSAGGWTIGEPWLHGLVGALEVWAALELLAGTRRARGLAIVYALAVIAVLVRGWLATYHGVDHLLDERGLGDAYAVRVGVQTLHTWALLTVPAVTLAVVLRPYEPLTRVRRGGA